MKYIKFLILPFLIQCSMNSADIRKGEYLDRAKESTVDDFFARRMKNKIKKVMGANWEIFFESEEFVYYGYPLISFFREGTFVDEFFKVDKNLLQLDFPSYKKFDGIELRRTCYESLAEYRRSTKESLFQSFNCTASLEKDFILIQADLFFKNENESTVEKYLIKFDKKNLKNISISKM